jgi:hypothetical protein
MTTVSSAPPLLEALTVAAEPAEPAEQAGAATFASALNERKMQGWDAREVWLERIKKPRDLRRSAP